MGTWRRSAILYLQIRNFWSAVHDRERKDYPDLFYEKDTILYAVISLENSEIQSKVDDEPEGRIRAAEKKHFAKIVVGPVSTEKHTKDSEHYLMRASPYQ